MCCDVREFALKMGLMCFSINVSILIKSPNAIQTSVLVVTSETFLKKRASGLVQFWTVFKGRARVMINKRRGDLPY